MELSKRDNLFKDAIETAAVSGKPEVVEELLRWVSSFDILALLNNQSNICQFVASGNKECYGAMLYACYDLIPVDVVMEISWRHGLSDYTMVSQLVFWI